ncbi:Retrovirus-related Pol polyprotein from transposon 17.6 [Mycena venus]|uniref:RNA-directed DNA polymerase n=1 Tax=Mycena venus TaxID=2733690 RepID=A0A8H6XX34_9AGAR|nr:Retrovirus-related Pol polyprotein from transposon 17.6 [Mycena venus]
MRTSAKLFTIEDAYTDEVVTLPLEYVRVPVFHLLDWYARQKAIALNMEYKRSLIHKFPIEEIFADAVQQYFVDIAARVPMFHEVGVARILREPNNLEGPDEYLVCIPVGELDLHEVIAEELLLNPRLDLVGWVLKKQLKCVLRENDARYGWENTHRDGFFDELFATAEPEVEGEFILHCGGVQIPADSVKGIAHTASTPRLSDRVVAQPLVIVVRVNGEPVQALVDSGSLGDLVSTSLADQLRLKRKELKDPITLQLAVQGSRSKINHSVNVKMSYQDITEERSFLVANLSGYDMILGTAWLFQHKVSIGLNPARVCVGSADTVPLEGVATARVFTGAVGLGDHDAIQAARDELLEYAKPICKTADEMGLPPLRAINHTIPLIDENKILPWRPSRCPEALRPQWDKKRSTYLKAGRWQITNAGNTAPMLFIPKVKTNPPGLRVVVDLRARNANTVKMTSPLPDMDGILRRVARCKFRSLIDGQDAYEQIRIILEHVPRTAVSTPDGNMISLVLQQGDCNAPATYQSLMNHLFGQYIGVFMDVYLDDIIVYSNILEDHIKHIKVIIDILEREKLYLSAGKMQLLKDELSVLGRVVGNGGIRMDPHKVDVMINWKVPTNRGLLRGFLGSVTYLGGDVPDIAKPMGILHELTSDSVPFRWSYTHQRAFEDVKFLVDKSRNHHCVPLDYTPGAPPIWLVTDGSSSAVAGVVCQGKSWKTAKIAAFFSAKLNSAQQNYAVHEIEMLAGVEAMLRHRDILQGCRFTWVTDHKGLIHLVNQKNLSGRQARWIEKTSSFDYQIEYVPGTENVLADALSRIYSNDAPGTVRARSEYTYHDVIDNNDLDIDSITMPVFAGLEAMALSSDRVMRSGTRRVLKTADAKSGGKETADAKSSGKEAADAKSTPDDRASSPFGSKACMDPKEGEGTRKSTRVKKLKIRDDTPVILTKKTEAETPPNKRPASSESKKGSPTLNIGKTTAVPVPTVSPAINTRRRGGRQEEKSGDTADHADPSSRDHSTEANVPADAYELREDPPRSGPTTALGDDFEFLDDSLLNVVNSGWQGLDLKDFISGKYAEDPFFEKILATLKAFRNFEVEEGLIYLKETDNRVLCIPKLEYEGQNLREIIIAEAHSLLAHLGLKKMLDYLWDHFWWKEIVDDTRSYCESCSTCKRSKPSNQKPYGFLHSLNPPSEPWDSMGVDFVGPLPESKNRNGVFNSLAVVIDLLTGMVHLIPTCINYTARQMAELMFEHVYKLHGLPKSIVSDRDSLFTSIFWKRLHELIGVKLRMSSAYHPETDGSTEQANRTVTQMLRQCIGPGQKDWVSKLPAIEFAMNSARSETTGYSPFFLNTGRMPRSLLWNSDRTREYAGVANFALQRRLAIMSAHDSMIAARVKQTRNANRKRQAAPFENGDLVYLSSKNVTFEKGLARKLIPKYIGPYAIIRDFGNNSFQLDLPANMKQRGVHDVFHSSLLRIHVPNDDRRFPGRLECQLGISLNDETNEWAVDRVLSHHGRRSKALFEILWKSGDKNWMPYPQAKRLEALNEYFEAIGISDIKELPYGQGRPPWELLNYLPTFIMTKKSAPRHPFHLGALTEDLDKLPEHMREFNVEHHALRRINRETFRFDAGDGAVELMSVTTVRHYMGYHLALCTEEDNPGLAPAYYDYFAATMNEHDGSGFRDGTILWDDTLEPADPKTFCILDGDIDTRVYLCAGEVATSEVELLDYHRLKDAETKNSVKWRKRRGEEKAQKELEASGLVSVSLDGFAKKRKRLQRLVDDEGKKKAHVDDTPGLRGRHAWPGGWRSRRDARQRPSRWGLGTQRGPREQLETTDVALVWRAGCNGALPRLSFLILSRTTHTPIISLSSTFINSYSPRRVSQTLSYPFYHHSDLFHFDPYTYRI